MILKDVPRNSFAIAGMFSCLASCFNGQGKDISPVILRGLWKKLFMFTFDAQKAGGAHDWTLFPDFATACETCTTMVTPINTIRIWNGPSLELIKEAINKNKPVITTWEPPEIHYHDSLSLLDDEETEKIYLHSYKRAFDEYPIEDFRRGWEKGRSEQPWLYGAIFHLQR